MKKRAILGTIGLLGLTFGLTITSLFIWTEPLLILAGAAASLGVLSLAASLLLGQRQILERLQDLQEREQISADQIGVIAQGQIPADQIRVIVREQVDGVDTRIRETVRREADALLWSMDSRLLAAIEAQTLGSEPAEDAE